MQVIAELDNVAFWLANHGKSVAWYCCRIESTSQSESHTDLSSLFSIAPGYFGNNLQKDTDDARKVKLTDQVPKVCFGLPLRPVILFILFTILSGLLMIVVIGQVSGRYFFEKYPKCGINPSLIPLVGNEICNGGVLNTFNCGFDGGDCIDFNMAFPNCDVLKPFEVGDGICQEMYNNDLCGYDGGDCCPFLDDDPFLGDTICHVSYNTKACDNDKGDCNDFISRYPDCDAEHDGDVKVKDGNPAVIGDGICSFTAKYMTAECGHEDGDCLGCVVDDPSRLGNNICDGGKYNTEACGYDLGDCLKCNDLVENVTLVGDGVCNAKEYNTEECGYDGGDCIDCIVDDPSKLGNGECDDSTYNSRACAFDAGDCVSRNEEIQERFPDCDVEEIGWIGNGNCDDFANIKECGFDSGDCFSINYPDCDADDPTRISDGICDSSPLFNNFECAWDGGDCDERNAEFHLKYPSCDWIVDVGHIDDGQCHMELNYEACGFDENDCTEFNEKFPDCYAVFPDLVGDGKCHDAEEFNNKECKWDGGDCVDVEEIHRKYPNCTWSQIAEVGDGYCDLDANIEECGFDDGDCFDINYPNCGAGDISNISNGKCDYSGTLRLNTPE